MKLRNYLQLILFITTVTLLQGMSKTGNLPADEFARRRAILINELQDLNAIAILHSAPEVPRNNDVNFPYRQDSDLFYLTGWTHSDAIIVLAPSEDQDEQAEVFMFVKARVPQMEVWTGPKQGINEAAALPGIDTAYAYADFFDHMQKFVSGYDRLVISYGLNHEFKLEFEKALEHSRRRPAITQEASSLIKTHRLIKSDAEIGALEKAIEITGKSLVETFAKIPTLKYEYEVQAKIEYGFQKRGAVRLGFPSIVGAGKNATFLHYEDNQGKLDSDDMLLMDVGAEWGFYSADISRTVPIDGSFSPEQAKIYQLVLDAQTAAIESVKPGAAFRKPHNVAIEVVTEGLVKLGLLKGDVKTLIKDQSYRKFFMHGTSHWLGLDVHDAGGYVGADGKQHKLKAGMVLTVEPGIYISEAENVDPKWWNIGVRIEDDVLVTKHGHRVLSTDIPKTIAEIEAIMKP